MSVSQSQICKITGTGAAINVSIGFEPGFIYAYNEDGNMTLAYSYNHGAGKGQKTYDEGTTETGIAEISSGGITAYAGGQIVDSTGALTGTAHPVVNEDGTALTNGKWSTPGFSIGTDSDLNVNGEVLNLLVIGRPDKTTTSTVYSE